MRRWAKRIAGALALFLLILAAPILWIEVACTTAREPGTLTRAPLVNEPGYARRESDSYLSFPEWHIVYAYEDLAGVLRRGDESDFAYGRQIVAFWTNLCGLTRVVTARGPVGTDTKDHALHDRVELHRRARHQGRLREHGRARLRAAPRAHARPRRTSSPRATCRPTRSSCGRHPGTSIRLAGACSRSGGARRCGATGSPARSSAGSCSPLEYGTKAVYGALIGYASGAALGAADLEIQTVVVGLEPGDAAREPKMRIVRELGGGRTLIRTPRYQAYTDLLVRLARRGRDVAEIAGNHRILVTVLAPQDPLPPVPGVTELFEAPIQSRPDRRRLGLDVSVEQPGRGDPGAGGRGRLHRAHLRLLSATADEAQIRECV